jgi:hypothetical protein
VVESGAFVRREKLTCLLLATTAIARYGETVPRSPTRLRLTVEGKFDPPKKHSLIDLCCQPLYCRARLMLLCSAIVIVKSLFTDSSHKRIRNAPSLAPEDRFTITKNAPAGRRPIPIPTVTTQLTHAIDRQSSLQHRRVDAVDLSAISQPCRQAHDRISALSP